MNNRSPNKKHRIAIDARLITDKAVGISRYSFNLILGILHKSDIELFCIVNTNHLASELEKRGKEERVSYIHAKSRPLSLSEHFEIPWLVARHGIELFHATSYMTPVWVPCNFVYSIHDTFHIIFPKGFSRIAKWYFRIVVRNAARIAKSIITVSDASKKDIEKHITSKKRIDVTYEGYDNIQKNEKLFTEITRKYGIEKKGYFLFLGNHRIHKNYERVIRAYHLAKEMMGLAPQLVMNLDREIQNKITERNSKANGDINFIGFVDDEDLYTVYMNALCLVVPSLYEGFGLNVLEAMDAGIPVITSNVSSLPEVAGDAALYVNPYDEKEMAFAMKRIAEDEKLRLTLVAKGKERIKLFSWQKCAESTYQIYKGILTRKETA